MKTGSQHISPQNGRHENLSPDLSLGAVIDRASRFLSRSGGELPQRFDFNWQDIAFTITPAGENAPANYVAIEARLGRLPFTAQDAAARHSALKLTGPATAKLPGRIMIDRAGNVRLVMEIGPVNAGGLASLLKEVAMEVLKTAERLKQLRGLLVD